MLKDQYLSLLIFLQTQGGDETQQLQKALLDYLEENADTDASLVVRFNLYQRWPQTVLELD